MILHPIVSQRAPRLCPVSDVETSAKARAEGSEYAWYVISPGYYACVHNDQIYTIEETAETIGCSCPKMTFRNQKDHNDVCKHVLAFRVLAEPPATPLTEPLKKAFRFEGYIGETFLIPPSAYQRQGTKKKAKPTPKPKPTPETKPETKATECQERTHTQDRWKGMSPAQMCQAMSDAELRKNARRGGVAAIAEVERRKAEANNG